MRSPEPFPFEARGQGNSAPMARSARALLWATRTVFTLGVLVILGAAIASGDMLVHGHPAYAVLLGVAFLACAVGALRSWLRPATRRWRFNALRWIGLAAACGILAGLWWLVPYGAIGPAYAAMESDAAVTVTETAGQIVMTPSGQPEDLGVFFQPGALVDARAYAAVLRPLAENGHTVIIPKQPLGIAFLSTGAFDAARSEHPPVDRWVLGGHSLGGVVAAMDAQSFAEASDDAVAGLLFFASYPATDMSALGTPVLSISASNDGLSTPEKITASKALLPPDATFTQIQGAAHSNFGDYGPQPGDGYPTIGRDQARAAISEASLDFVESLKK